MKPIKSLLEKRQFLAGAGMTSASALALGKLAGAVNPVFQTRAAKTSDKSGTAEMKGERRDP